MKTIRLGKDAYPPKIEKDWFQSPKKLLEIAEKARKKHAPDAQAPPPPVQDPLVEAPAHGTGEVTLETFKNTGITELHLEWRGKRSAYRTSKKKYMKAREDYTSNERDADFYCAFHDLQEIFKPDEGGDSAPAPAPASSAPAQHGPLIDGQTGPDLQILMGDFLRPQIDPHYCWAAVTQMLELLYGGNDISQVELRNRVFDGAALDEELLQEAADALNLPVDTVRAAYQANEGVVLIPEGVGHTPLNAMAQLDVKHEIDNHRPFVVFSGTHYYLGIGYQTNPDRVVVFDPLPVGRGTVRVWDRARFNQVLGANGGIYRFNAAVGPELVLAPLPPPPPAPKHLPAPAPVRPAPSTPAGPVQMVYAIKNKQEKLDTFTCYLFARQQEHWLVKWTPALKATSVSSDGLKSYSEPFPGRYREIKECPGFTVQPELLEKLKKSLSRGDGTVSATPEERALEKFRELVFPGGALSAENGPYLLLLEGTGARPDGKHVVRMAWTYFHVFPLKLYQDWMECYLELMDYSERLAIIEALDPVAFELKRMLRRLPKKQRFERVRRRVQVLLQIVEQFDFVDHLRHGIDEHEELMDAMTGLRAAVEGLGLVVLSHPEAAHPKPPADMPEDPDGPHAEGLLTALLQKLTKVYKTPPEAATELEELKQLGKKLLGKGGAYPGWGSCLEQLLPRIQVEGFARLYRSIEGTWMASQCGVKHVDEGKNWDKLLRSLKALARDTDIGSLSSLEFQQLECLVNFLRLFNNKLYFQRVHHRRAHFVFKALRAILADFGARKAELVPLVNQTMPRRNFYLKHSRAHIADAFRWMEKIDTDPIAFDGGQTSVSSALRQCLELLETAGTAHVLLQVPERVQELAQICSAIRTMADFIDLRSEARGKRKRLGAFVKRNLLNLPGLSKRSRQYKGEDARGEVEAIGLFLDGLFSYLKSIPDIDPKQAGSLATEPPENLVQSIEATWKGQLIKQLKAMQSKLKELSPDTIGALKDEVLQGEVEKARKLIDKLLKDTTGAVSGMSYRLQERIIADDPLMTQDAQMTAGILTLMGVYGNIVQILRSKSKETKVLASVSLLANASGATSWFLKATLVEPVLPVTEPPPETTTTPTDSQPATIVGDPTATDAQTDGTQTEPSAEPTTPELAPADTLTLVIDTFTFVSAGLGTIVSTWKAGRRLYTFVQSGKLESWGEASLETQLTRVGTFAHEAIKLTNGAFYTLRTGLTVLNDLVASPEIAAFLLSAGNVAGPLNAAVAGLDLIKSGYRFSRSVAFNLQLRTQRRKIRKWYKAYVDEQVRDNPPVRETWEQIDTKKLAAAMAANRHIARILTKREITEAINFSLAAVDTASLVLYASGYGAGAAFALNVASAGIKLGRAVSGATVDWSRKVRADGYQNLKLKMLGRRSLKTKQKLELYFLLDYLKEGGAAARLDSLGEDWQTAKERFALADELAPLESYDYAALQSALGTVTRSEVHLQRRGIKAQLGDAFGAAGDLSLSELLTVAELRAELHELKKNRPSRVAEVRASRVTQALAHPLTGAQGMLRHYHKRAQQLVNRKEGRYSLSSDGFAKLMRYEAERDLRKALAIWWRKKTTGESPVDVTSQEQTFYTRYDLDVSALFRVLILPNWTKAAGVNQARHLKHALAIVNLDPTNAYEGKLRQKLIHVLLLGDTMKLSQQLESAQGKGDLALAKEVFGKIYTDRQLVGKDFEEALQVSGLAKCAALVSQYDYKPGELWNQIIAEVDGDDTAKGQLLLAIQTEGRKLLLAGLLVKRMEKL